MGYTGYSCRYLTISSSRAGHPASSIASGKEETPPSRPGSCCLRMGHVAPRADPQQCRGWCSGRDAARRDASEEEPPRSAHASAARRHPVSHPLGGSSHQLTPAEHRPSWLPLASAGCRSKLMKKEGKNDAASSHPGDARACFV